MSGAAEVDWIEPYTGLTYRDRVMSVAAHDQHRLLRLCGIDPAVFGDQIDPAAFITLAIQEGVRNRIHANGTVNLAQRLVQHRPMALGEPLTVSGRIVDVQEVPRGRVVSSETWFCGADGQRALTTGRLSLRPGAEMASASGTGEKPAPVVADLAGLKVLGTATLTPEGVTAYTGPENPIHFDPEVAIRKGYRAPIVGGGAVRPVPDRRALAAVQAAHPGHGDLLSPARFLGRHGDRDGRSAGRSVEGNLPCRPWQGDDRGAHHRAVGLSVPAAPPQTLRKRREATVP